MESRNRKPLSDITNTYNLIPTSALRKLVAASSSSTSNSFHKPPLSVFKSNSSSTNQKLFSESSSRSNTSVGSSNVSATFNSKTLHSRSPPPSISSISSPALAEGGIGSKDAAYNQRHIVRNSKKEREADVVAGRTPLEKGKDKGNAIAVPFSSSPTKKMTDNPNMCNLSTTVERQNQKGIANLRPSSGSVEIAKGSEKRILNSYSRSFEKAEKGKALFNSSSCASGEQKEIGKGIADNSCCSLEVGKQGIPRHSRSSIVKIKDIGQEFLNTSGFSAEKAKDKGKPLKTFNPSYEKTRDKGKAILQSSDLVEIAKLKGSSAAVAVKSQPPRRKSEKRKNDAGASSCPPMMRTKNTKNDFDEAGDIKSSKSWTDPLPKCRKKRCSKIENSGDLPQDFIEQQRAYFKEVDEFELPEEEATPGELD